VPAHRGLHRDPKTSTGKIQKHVLRGTFPLHSGDRGPIEQAIEEGARHGRDRAHRQGRRAKSGGGAPLVRPGRLGRDRPADPHSRRRYNPLSREMIAPPAGGARCAGRRRGGARGPPRSGGPRILRGPRPRRDAQRTRTTRCGSPHSSRSATS
jgi:hypothetical protein